MKGLRICLFALCFGCARVASAGAIQPPGDLVQLGQLFFEDDSSFGLFPTFHVVNDSSFDFFYSLLLSTDAEPPLANETGEVALATDRLLTVSEFEHTTAAPDPLTFDNIFSATLGGIRGADVSFADVLFSLDGGSSFTRSGVLSVSPVFGQSPSLTVWAQPVPEPGTLLLMLAGGAFLTIRRRKA
jgi:hypothetical protein